MTSTTLRTLVRHEGEVPRERSTCGWRDRLISNEDTEVAAWVHAVDIDGAREHYHKRSAELYCVLEGERRVVLVGVEQVVRKGSLVHIPPGVVAWIGLGKVGIASEPGDCPGSVGELPDRQD